MNTYIDKQGFVRFKSNHRLVHRYIAKKEIYSKDCGFTFSECIVNHINGDKTDNSLDNLELVTPNELLDFKKSLGIKNTDSRDNILKKYLKKYQKTFQIKDIEKLDAILTKKKFTRPISFDRIKRLRKELLFEKDYSEKS